MMMTQMHGRYYFYDGIDINNSKAPAVTITDVLSRTFTRHFWNERRRHIIPHPSENPTFGGAGHFSCATVATTNIYFWADPHSIHPQHEKNDDE